MEESLSNFKVDTLYLHKLTGYLYYYDYDDMWMPAEGQGLDNTPRPLVGKYMEQFSMEESFEVGDIVKLKTGFKPIKVLSVSNGRLFGRYLSSSYETLPRNIEDFECYDQTHTGEDTVTKLYEVKESENTTTFATKLAVNSNSLWVMEEKGTGRVFTVTPSSAEEVMPYTISVKFFDTPHKKYDYLAEKGYFEPNQVFMSDTGSLCYIVDVDTKSKVATKDFKPTLKFEVKAL